MVPKPDSGEKLEHYVSRFMGAKKEQKYPQKQRAAIAYAEFRKAKKKH
jgi:hypothetical protein